MGATLDRSKTPPMSWEGVGPRMALYLLPFLIGGILVRVLAPELSAIPLPVGARVVLGWIAIACGLAFWGWSAVYFLRRFFDGALLTGGPYAWCRNPIYGSMIVFVFPGAALVANAWPLLVADLALWVAFRATIAREYQALEGGHGAAYRSYAAATPELVPIPPWLRPRR